MVWIAEIGRDRSMPLDQVHVALYSYFPQVAHGEGRPYVWRLLDAERLLVASHLRPTANGAREVVARQGLTYDFRATIKRARNVRGSYTRPDGTRRNRTPRAVEMKDHDEIKRWATQFAEKRGGDIRYIRVENMCLYRPKHGVALPICTLVGKVFVRDADAFDQFLASGGPGTGKAYGLGMWYLPEIMEAHRAAA